MEREQVIDPSRGVIGWKDTDEDGTTRVYDGSGKFKGQSHKDFGTVDSHFNRVVDGNHPDILIDRKDNE